MNLNVSEIYAEELKKLEEEDFIRKQIRSGLEKILSETVKEAFTSYKFKNVISDKLEKIANDAVKDIGFDGYSNYIKKNLMEQIDEVQKNTLESLISEATKEYFESPKEIKLYDLIEKFIKEKRNENGEGYGEYMTVIIDDEFIRESNNGKKFGTVYIALDEEENKNKYNCQYRFSIDVESCKIEAIEINGDKYTGKVVVGRIHDKFEAMLYKTYFNETKIIDFEDISSDDFNTRRCEGDY